MKTIKTLTAALFLLAAFAFTSYAQNVPFMDDQAFADYISQGVRIFDAADLITDGEEKTLQESLEKFEGRYGQPALIVTSAALSGDASDNEMDAYADGIWAASGLKDGSILVVDMGCRNAYIQGQNEAARYFTDSAINQIFDTYNGGIWTLIGEGNFAGAFERYVGSINDLYARGVQQDQVNYDTVTGETDPYYQPEKKPFIRLWQLILSLISAAGISFAPVSRVKKQYAMEAEKKLAQSVSKAYRANSGFSYGAAPAAALIDRNVKRVLIPRAQISDQDKNQGGMGGQMFGGGQSTIRPSSGGGGHTGGGRKF